MSKHERRIAPRKSYAIPVRFTVVSEQNATVGVANAATVPAHPNAKLLTTIPPPQQGEIVNLSERGIAFKTRQNLSVGETMEIFFTLPTALTARAPEDVRCRARVVRVEKDREISGMLAIGAAIDRFERTALSRNWDN
jgi:PilZ domain